MTPTDGHPGVSPEERAHAHEVLDRWLDSLPADAHRAWERGRGGYTGKLVMLAFADDDEITLNISRTAREDR